MTRKLVSLFLALVLVCSLAVVSGAEEPVTITMMTSEHPQQPMSETAPILDYIYEATGIRVELQSVPENDYNTKVSAKINANDMPDMIRRITKSNFKELQHLGNFACISDYIDDMPNLQAWMDKYPEEFASLCIDGKLYGTPYLIKMRDMYMGFQPMIRGDVLDELGLEMPTTWDEMFDVLMAMKEAYPDSYPYGSRKGATQILGKIAYDFGTGYGLYFEPNINEYAYGFTSETFVDVLDFLAKCYANGLLDPDYATADGNKWNDNSSNGTYLYAFDNPTFAYNWDAAIKQTNPDAYWTPVPVLTAPNGAFRRMGVASQDFEALCVVSAKSEHIEECIKVIDWMYSEDGINTTNFGKLGVSYEINADGRPQYNAAVLEASKEFGDPWRGVQGTYGLGQHGITLVLDDTSGWAFMSETVQGWQAYWSGCLDQYTEPKTTPNLTYEEQQRFNELNTNLNTYFTSIVDSYITGKIPVDEYTKEFEKFLELGSEELVEIYNNALNR